jgi:hypothetical protein
VDRSSNLSNSQGSQDSRCTPGDNVAAFFSPTTAGKYPLSRRQEVSLLTILILIYYQNLSSYSAFTFLDILSPRCGYWTSPYSVAHESRGGGPNDLFTCC